MSLSFNLIKEGSPSVLALYTMGFYLTPNALSWLCTSVPGNKRIDQLRRGMAFLQEEIKGSVGRKTWFVLTDIVADNAWIAFSTLSYLARGKKTIEPSEAATAWFSFCAGAWLIRFSVVKYFPNTRRLIATRSDNNQE
jgi:hypothetical protein